MYMLQYVPIVIISCNYIFIQKKKKKKRKTTHTLVWVKYQSYATIPAIYLLSWEREGILTSQTLYKANYKCTF